MNPPQAWQDFEEEIKRENLATEKAIETCVAAVRETAVDKVIAACLDAVSTPALFLQWAAERFWAAQFAKAMPDIERIYDALVEQKITQKDPLNFNDGDDDAFYIPHRTKKVFVYTTQNYNMLFVWDKRDTKYRQVHVRRFYDVYNPVDKFDAEEETEEETEFKKKVAKEGYKPAIMTDWTGYADDYKENTYPDRYSLNHYGKKFDMEYGDARDKGYIATWEEIGNKVDDAIHHHGVLELLFTCYIPSLVYELFGDENERMS